MRPGPTVIALISLLLHSLAMAQSPAELGRVLFFDARLSGDGTRSCADCHDPEQGFSKQVDASGSLQSLSDGYTGSQYFRNAPTLINISMKRDRAPTYWGWDGRTHGFLPEAIGIHMESPRIMHIDPLLLRERMKQDRRYVDLCRRLFDDECRHAYTIEALSEFVSTLSSSELSDDRYPLSASAERGRALFTGKAGCSDCHSGPSYTDLKLHRTGVPENPEVFDDPLRHLSYRSMLADSGMEDPDQWRRDVGFFVVSGNASDIGSFVTPTLRELRYTAPYMHNGIFESLPQVVDFYDAGTEFLPALGLAPQERIDLAAFLESLSSREPIEVQIEDVSQEYLPMEDWLERPN